MQVQAVSTCLKKSWSGRREAWLNRQLWLDLKKGGGREFWKKGQASQADYKEILELYREKIRRVKGQGELISDIIIKDSNKIVNIKMFL